MSLIWLKTVIGGRRLKMPNYKNITHCRLCFSPDLQEVVSFEPQYIASTFVKTNEGRENPKIPLTLLLCDECKLVQLKETVNPELLYKDYFYRSNVSDTMNRDLRDVVRDACSRVNLTPDDAVLDIGCNDGLMLTMYPRSVWKTGVDPAENIDRTAIPEDNKTVIIQDYFPTKDGFGKQYKIITATACFYDMDDPNRAVQEIKTLLHPEGVAIIQVSYLYDTIKDMNFYDVCHEHLEYYSLRTLMTLFERNGLHIIDATTNAVNGGSLRVVVAHEDGQGHLNQSELLRKEEELGLDDPETYRGFANSINESVAKVRDYIKSQESVIGLGASTKGNVLLQICDIDKEDLPYISERNPFKVGLRTMGGDIELISEEAAREMKADVMFVIPWNFKDEIVAREQEYIQNGGKLLFIMPYPYYIDKDGEHKL
jgi:SAM-dependent methyltransferase